MKKKLKELKGVVNSLLEFDYRITDMKYLLYRMIANAETVDFELDLLTGKMTPKRTDDLALMYKEKHKWFISRTKELGLYEEIASARLTLIQGKETIRVETKDGRVFENSVGE